MIAGIVIAAVLIAPPEGPFRWKGEEVQLRPLVRYFRIASMKEPTPTEVAREPYYGNDPVASRSVPMPSRPLPSSAVLRRPTSSMAMRIRRQTVLRP